jgi:lysophospholipase L1-like esterase
VLVDTATKQSKLIKEDTVIFWGGTNDIARNACSKGLTHTMKTMMKNQHTNIILINARCGFGMDNLSCVNEEVRAFNRELSKIAKRFGNTSVVNVELQRRIFTLHGLHINIKGKKVMVKRLAAVIPEIIGSHKKTDPVCLTW